MPEERPDVEEPLSEEKRESLKTGIYVFTKYAIVGILLLVLIIGIFGSMEIGIFSSFDMDSYVAFLNSYKGMFMTLIGSIGIGGAAKNIVSSRKNKDDGKNVATGG